LVSRGYPSDKVTARGIGPDRPIASNDSAEGRANNRRVEIVVQPGTGPSTASAP
jgi:outer membrane protein OmpA-like peptidoglycan-associated protein